MTQTNTAFNAAQYRDDRKRRGNALGWSWVSDYSCPLKLVGKRCQSAECWCKCMFRDTDGQRLFGRLNDHGGTWRDSNDEKFVLWEPYGPIEGDHLAQLSRLAASDGLRIAVTASTWYPPSTVGIAFYKEGKHYLDTDLQGRRG